MYTLNEKNIPEEYKDIIEKLKKGDDQILGEQYADAIKNSSKS